MLHFGLAEDLCGAIVLLRLKMLGFVMARRKWKFAPSEVSRAIKIARDNGLAVDRVEIGPDGRIVIGTRELIEPAPAPKVAMAGVSDA